MRIQYVQCTLKRKNHFELYRTNTTGFHNVCMCYFTSKCVILLSKDPTLQVGDSLKKDKKQIRVVS